MISHNSMRIFLCIILSIQFTVSIFFYDSLFFVDSNTYHTDITQSNDAIHRFIFEFGSGLRYALASANLLLLSWLLWRLPVSFAAPFFHPYFVLLYFNLTKEQLIFFGVFALLVISRLEVVNRNSLRASLIFFFPFLLVRSIYAPFFITTLAYNFFLRRKHAALLAVILFFIVLVICHSFIYEEIASLVHRLQGRAGFTHVGRPYFIDLCVIQKSEFFQFFPCWLGMRVGVMWHDQVLSQYYLLHLSFLLCLLLIFRNLLRMMGVAGVLPIALILVGDFFVFWWGPGLGAYQRYVAPLWLGVYAILIITNAKSSKSLSPIAINHNVFTRYN